MRNIFLKHFDAVSHRKRWVVKITISYWKPKDYLVETVKNKICATLSISLNPNFSNIYDFLQNITLPAPSFTYCIVSIYCVFKITVLSINVTITGLLICDFKLNLAILIIVIKFWNFGLSIEEKNPETTKVFFLLAGNKIHFMTR